MIEENHGFTLLELTCAVMILIVLGAVMVPLGRRFIRSAELARERVQAKSLWTAVQMYLIEENVQDELRSYVLLEELGTEAPDSLENPLYPYLPGKLSGHAAIQSLTVSKDHSMVTELVYQTDQWTVTVSRDSIVMKQKNVF